MNADPCIHPWIHSITQLCNSVYWVVPVYDDCVPAPGEEVKPAVLPGDETEQEAEPEPVEDTAGGQGLTQHVGQAQHEAPGRGHTVLSMSKKYHNFVPVVQGPGSRSALIFPLGSGSRKEKLKKKKTTKMQGKW